MRIETVPSKSGYPNARVILDDKEVSLHSRDPFREAERVIKRFNPNVKWIVIGGAGLFYIPQYILEHTDWNVIVFEHNPMIMEHAATVRDLSAVNGDPRLRVFGSTDDMISFLTRSRINELNFYIHRPYMSLFPEEYSSLEGILITYLSKKQINQATFLRFQKLWLRNIIKNSRYYFEFGGINTLRHSFGGKPAVIVGAGPSLAKNIDVLSRYQDRLLIIATDTALPMLLTRDIRPDFTVSVDPQNKNAQYLLYSSCPNTTLVLDCTASYQVFAKTDMNRKLIYDNAFPLYKRLNGFWGEKGTLKAGGSVSTSAFDLARTFACDPIIFIGQDLAFSKKKTHFDGNILEDFLYYRIDRLHTYDNYNTRMLLLSDKIRINGWNGTQVNTDRKFATFLEWFQREIAETSQKVINATEGGAYLNGAEHISLNSAIERYCSSPIDKQFTVENESSDQGDYLRFLHNLYAELNHFVDLALRAHQSALKCLQLYRSKKSLSSYVQDMNRFDVVLLDKIKKDTLISDFLEMTMQHSIQRILDQAAEKEVGEETVENWVSIYREAHDGLRFIRRLLEKRMGMEK